MGWFFSNQYFQSIKDYAKSITKRQENEHGIWETTKSSLRGQHLWTIMQVYTKKTKETKSFIVLYLIERYKGQWGYKDVSEDMGPNYYDCPVTFLKLVDKPMNKYSEKWRTTVRMYWDRYNARQRAKRLLKV